MANPNWQPAKLSKAEQKIRDNVKSQKPKIQKAKVSKVSELKKSDIRKPKEQKETSKVTKKMLYDYLKKTTKLLNREIKEICKKAKNLAVNSKGEITYE